jgi:hypothetical protein
VGVRNQKRLVVLRRLSQADASGLSDREIARQCAVSQPFVSKLRHAIRAEVSGAQKYHADKAADNGCVVSIRPLLWVQAKMLGFYGGSRRRPGHMFQLAAPEHFSSRWMVRLPTIAPTRT